MDNKEIKKLLEDFQKQVEKKLSQFESTFNNQASYIKKQLETIQIGIDRLDRDLGSDRTEIMDQKFAMNDLRNQVTEVRSLFHSQTEKIKDSVHDAVGDKIEPVEKAVQEVKDLIPSVEENSKK